MKIVDRELKKKWSETYEAAIERPASLAWCFHCGIGFTVYPQDIHKSRHTYKAKTFCPICGGSCTVSPYSLRYRLRHAAQASSAMTALIQVVLAVLTFIVYMSLQLALLAQNFYLGVLTALIPFAIVGLCYYYWEPRDEWPKDQYGHLDRKRVREALKRGGENATLQSVGHKPKIKRVGARGGSDQGA